MCCDHLVAITNTSLENVMGGGGGGGGGSQDPISFTTSATCLHLLHDLMHNHLSHDTMHP